MGMQIDTVATADKKDEALRFMQRNFPEIKHMFAAAAHLIDGGMCKKCSNTCTLDESESPDLCTAGLPCQPFSSMRWKTGPGQNEKGVKAHTLWKVFMEFIAYLTERRPKGFVVEEVMKLLDRDRTSGKRYLDMLMEKASDLGYGCSAIKLSASCWLASPRDRL